MTIDMKIHFLITVFASAMACSAVHTAEVHKDIFRPGEFFIGCNYWGSKDGVHMWNAGRWDPAEIEKDIAALEAEKKQIEEALCGGTTSVDEITAMSKRLPVLNDELDEKSLRWLELSEIES